MDPRIKEIIKSDNSDRLRQLLETHELSTEDKSILLRYAVALGHPECSKLLLHAGVNINYSKPGTKIGASIIESAILGNNEDCVRLILEYGGVDVNNRNPLDRTPLDYAISKTLILNKIVLLCLQ